MLMILSGLPAVGKSTIARLLATRMGAMHLRIDTIEQAIVACTAEGSNVGPAGYVIAYRVAADNLRLGLSVVADSVNPVEASRMAWYETAEAAGVGWLDLEIVCSDADEHRRRVEERMADIAGHKLPSWSDVMRREYEPWTRERFVIDTAHRSAEDCVVEIAARMKGIG